MKSVLGGGIGGLSAAYYLNLKYPSELIKLFESQSSTGGWIRSRISPSGNMFEQGPRTLRPKGRAGFNTLQLVDDLGLSDKIVPIHANHPAAKTRMIYANGKLHTLPSSLLQIFRQISPFSKPLVSYLLNDLTAKPKMSPNNDESIYDFVERRFGKDIAQYAISPMICGICAGDAKEISVKFLMESIYDNEQKYGGVIKGFVYDWWANKGHQEVVEDSSSLIDVAQNEKWSIYSFEGGMETLTSTLVHKLKDQRIDFLLNKHCDQIDFIGNDTAVLSIDGHSQEAITNHVISSLPASTLGDLVQHQHPELTTLLKQIPVVTVAVVNLCYKTKIPLQNAFGFLVPPTENLPILGVIFDSCCFPYKDSTVLTVMMGGHWFQKLFGEHPKEEYLLETAVQQMRQILNIVVPPDEYKVNILHDCIPQYVVGHFARVANIQCYIQAKKLPLSICGSSYYGVGVNDVILSAKNAIDAL